MAARIIFDFFAANQQANALEETAEAVKNLADRKLEETTLLLDSAWKSEASVIYLQKLRLLQESIRKTAADIEKTAQNLRYRSRKLHEAEQAAAQIATTGGR